MSRKRQELWRRPGQQLWKKERDRAAAAAVGSREPAPGCGAVRPCGIHASGGRGAAGLAGVRLSSDALCPFGSSKKLRPRRGWACKVTPAAAELQRLLTQLCALPPSAPAHPTGRLGSGHG